MGFRAEAWARKRDVSMQSCPLRYLFCLKPSSHVRLHVTDGRKDMPPSLKSKPSREKVRAHRDRLREQGLRPIQIWVPDMRAPGFRKEAHRQSLAVAMSAQARDDQEFIDAVSGWGDE
jgi:Protein  of unknown function (DUF3018)